MERSPRIIAIDHLGLMHRSLLATKRELRLWRSAFRAQVNPTALETEPAVALEFDSHHVAFWRRSL
jgi:hypothetical protein